MPAQLLSATGQNRTLKKVRVDPTIQFTTKNPPVKKATKNVDYEGIAPYGKASEQSTTTSSWVVFA